MILLNDLIFFTFDHVASVTTKFLTGTLVVVLGSSCDGRSA